MSRIIYITCKTTTLLKKWPNYPWWDAVILNFPPHLKIINDIPLTYEQWYFAFDIIPNENGSDWVSAMKKHLTNDNNDAVQRIGCCSGVQGLWGHKNSGDSLYLFFICWNRSNKYVEKSYILSISVSLLPFTIQIPLQNMMRMDMDMSFCI